MKNLVQPHVAAFLYKFVWCVIREGCGCTGTLVRMFSHVVHVVTSKILVVDFFVENTAHQCAH